MLAKREVFTAFRNLKLLVAFESRYMQMVKIDIWLGKGRNNREAKDVKGKYSQVLSNL